MYKKDFNLVDIEYSNRDPKRFMVVDPVYNDVYFCDTNEQAVNKVVELLREHVNPLDGMNMENAYVPGEILNGNMVIYEQIAHVDGYATKKRGASGDYTQEEMNRMLIGRDDWRDYPWSKGYDFDLHLRIVQNNPRFEDEGGK